MEGIQLQIKLSSPQAKSYHGDLGKKTSNPLRVAAAEYFGEAVKRATTTLY